MNMPRIAIIFGCILIALGAGTYVASGQTSVTALIPSAFGIILAILGTVAGRPEATKHAMHAAAALALLGLLGAARGLPGAVRLALGETVERPLAVASMAAMALLMAVFVGLCVKSFVDARRARQ